MMLASLFVRALQHGLCEIAADHWDPVRSPVAPSLQPNALHRERQIPGAAAQIQNASVGAAQHSLKLACGALAPHAIERQRKQVVQKIVARRNSAEHFPDMRGSLAFAASAFRTRTRRLRRKYRGGHDRHAVINPWPSRLCPAILKLCAQRVSTEARRRAVLFQFLAAAPSELPRRALFYHLQQRDAISQGECCPAEAKARRSLPNGLCASRPFPISVL